MIRKASVEDLDSIRKMADVVFRHTYKQILSPEQMEYMMDMMYSEESLRNQMTRDGHIFHIAPDKGYVSFRRDGITDDGRLLFHLEKLYVLPSFHKTGLGLTLFNTVVENVRIICNGRPARIELNVNRNNPAVGFYENIGMKKSRSGDFPIGNGYYMNDYIMSLDIQDNDKGTAMNTDLGEIYFAGGCFWGTEKYFKLKKGVVFTEVGYANGHTDNPTYKEVYTDTTGYAECVHVRYDRGRTDLRHLVELFFKAIDPTSVNRQGEDSGTRYRTGVYYDSSVSKDELSVIKSVFEAQEAIWGKLAVEFLPLNNFVRAEEYHQDYLEKNPDGYCHLSPDMFVSD